MRQSDIELETYWVTQSGYFILATTVALGMGITDGKLLYCHGVAEGNVDNKISTLDNNNMRVYYCFNNPFTAYFGSPDLHLPPIKIYDRPRTNKIARCTPYLIPAAISVATKNHVITLTTPYYLPYLLPSGIPILSML